MSDYHRRNGQLGGISTLIKHGSPHFSKIGRVGGKHCQPTLSELQAKTAQLNMKEERLPTALTKLKALYRQKKGGSSVCH